MRTNKALLVLSFFVLLANSISAQIKIFPGGNISAGFLSTPYSGVKLHVAGDAVFSSSPNTSQSSALIHGNNEYSTANNPEYTWRGDNKTGIFHPTANMIGFSIAGVEQMRITPLSNFLIGGTYDNNTKLSIDAGLDKGNQINYSKYSFDWAYAEMSLVNRATTKSWVVTYNGIEKFSVLGAGIVIGYGGFWTPSDRTLKENIDSIASPLQKLMKIRGVKYNYKPEVKKAGDSVTVIPTTPPVKYLGVIAQELEQIVPEAVMTLPDGKKAVCYQNLIPLLIEGFKIQQKKLDALQTQVNSLLNPKPLSITNGANISNSSTTNIISAARLDTTTKLNATLFQNVPNPFNESTTIKFTLPETASNAFIMVFDLQGKQVKNYSLTKGVNSIQIQGGELEAGMYLYSLVVDNNEIDTKRMILTKSN